MTEQAVSACSDYALRLRERHDGRLDRLLRTWVVHVVPVRWLSPQFALMAAATVGRSA